MSMTGLATLILATERSQTDSVAGAYSGRGGGRKTPRGESGLQARRRPAPMSRSEVSLPRVLQLLANFRSAQERQRAARTTTRATSAIAAPQACGATGAPEMNTARE